MGLIATYISETGTIEEVVWHVGEPPINPVIASKPDLKVLADGDELDLINEQIDGIPRARYNRVAQWFGDDARFIVRNLRENSPPWTPPWPSRIAM